MVDSDDEDVGNVDEIVSDEESEDDEHDYQEIEAIMINIEKPEIGPASNGPASNSQISNGPVSDGKVSNEPVSNNMNGKTLDNEKYPEIDPQEDTSLPKEENIQKEHISDPDTNSSSNEICTIIEEGQEEQVTEAGECSSSTQEAKDEAVHFHDETEEGNENLPESENGEINDEDKIVPRQVGGTFVLRM